MRALFSGLVVGLLLVSGATSAMAVDAAVQAKIDAKAAVVAEWGKDAALVSAVKELNAAPLPEAAGMEQAAWEKLSVLDPKIRAFQNGKAGAFLKSKKDVWVAEAFVSLADGTKAGFLGKTSGWSHKGKPKHDVPMTGKNWQGEPEMDKSSGKEQVQIAVPVLDGATSIGSLVVGLDIGKI